MNYYDGAWRPVTNTTEPALARLRVRGFEFGSTGNGRLMARWPIAPAAPALTFTGIPLDYWREEVRLGCTVSLDRLRRIVEQRGGDYDKTIAALQED